MLKVIQQKKVTTEKCSICPWTGKTDKALYTEKDITATMSIKLRLHTSKATLLCCPKYGGILQSELNAAKKRNPFKPPITEEVYTFENSDKKSKKLTDFIFGSTNSVRSWLRYSFFDKRGKR